MADRSERGVLKIKGGVPLSSKSNRKVDVNEIMVRLFFWLKFVLMILLIYGSWKVCVQRNSSLINME